MPSGYAYDGRCRVFWLDTEPSDPDAPTTTELDAGTDLSGYAIPDGIAYNLGNSRVSGADLLSSFDAEAMGRFQASPSITFKSKLVTGETLAWDTLGARLLSGTLVVFEDVVEGDEVADGDSCFVFPSCQTGQPVIQNTAMNQERRFVVDFAVGDSPHLRAVVGGS